MYIDYQVRYPCIVFFIFCTLSQITRSLVLTIFIFSGFDLVWSSFIISNPVGSYYYVFSLRPRQKTQKNPETLKKKHKILQKCIPKLSHLPGNFAKTHKRTRRLCKNASRNYHTNPETLKKTQKNPETLQKNTKAPGDFAKMHPEIVTLTRKLCKKTKNPETLQKCIPKLSH